MRVLIDVVQEEGKLPSTDSSNRESEESKEKIQLLYKKLAHRNAGLGGVDVVPEQRHGLFAWAGYLYITYYYS